VLIKVEEEMTNVGRLSVLSIGCQPVHQLPNDTFPIHHLFSEYARSKVVARVRVML
jgi:hypothetical protein